MRSHVNITICAALAAFGAGSSVAQPLTGAPASPEFKFSTPLPPGVASPDTVDTRFGALTSSTASRTRPAPKKSTTIWTSARGSGLSARAAGGEPGG